MFCTLKRIVRFQSSVTKLEITKKKTCVPFILYKSYIFLKAQVSAACIINELPNPVYKQLSIRMCYLQVVQRDMKCVYVRSVSLTCYDLNHFYFEDALIISYNKKIPYYSKCCFWGFFCFFTNQQVCKQAIVLFLSSSYFLIKVS